MLKRPSLRRRSTSEQIELNLVPILDTMVTLIAFLLFTSSFLSVVSIETPFPQASAQSNQEKLKERPLQLTLSLREKDVQIWSPFEKIETKRIPHAEEGKPDLLAIHEALIEVKKRFPAESKIILAPHAGVNYDTLIAVMDNVRTLTPTDPPLFAKNAETGMDEALKALFPEVIFGNLLGD